MKRESVFSEEQNKMKNEKDKKLFTFPVPFSLDEIREITTINTYSLEQNSANEVINKALKLHSMGNIIEAAKLYQYIINKGVNEVKVYSNYSLILKEGNQLKKAEKLIRKAINLNPNYANAHYNLGTILIDLNRSKEAELSFRKAIEIKSNFAEAHLNLGSILSHLGKLREAQVFMRKAVDLNPCLIEAHTNLGSILIDLGQFKDLLVLLKSTLQLSSINLGDKLLASLQLSICNLIQGDFSETLVNINRNTQLIKEGAIDFIKDEKNKIHVSTFSKFINSLYPQLEKVKNNTMLEKIPHIGESHCLSFSHQTIYIFSKLKKIQPVLIIGGKAWHFSQANNNKWKDSLKEQIKSHIYSDEILISFGEIDCRREEGILPYAIKNNKNISKLCKETIIGYLDYMETVLSHYFSKRFYFGIPSPYRSNKIIDKLDLKRIEMIKTYNYILKNEILQRGSFFLDVYALTSNQSGENNNLHMCDKYHLSPKCLSILFENHLYTPY